MRPALTEKPKTDWEEGKKKTKTKKKKSGKGLETI